MEAKKWLINSKNECALAGNRFGNTDDALKFVEMLYEKGAIEVSVICKTGMKDYADALTVKLPQDKNKRNQLLEIYYDEMESELGPLDEFLTSSGFPKDEIEKIKEEILDSNILEFWWD